MPKPSASGGSISDRKQKRRGISKKKQGCQKYDAQRGSDRQVTLAAVQFLDERFTGFNKLNTAQRRGLFFAAQRLSYCDPQKGSRLPQKGFSCPRIGRFIQEGLVDTGVAKCLDWDSWKPTGRDLRNVYARSFLPCWEFLWAGIGKEVVSSFPAYLARRVETRLPLHQETTLVLPKGECGVILPSTLIAALNRGTGLYCDYEALRTILLTRPANDRSRLLCSALSAIGRAPVEELRPLWTQAEAGRLYASKPAAINMPKVLLPALRSNTGSQLWNVDFSSYELRIACRVTDQTLPNDDAYELLAKHSGVSRPKVKDVITAMLHGQTQQHCEFSREPGCTRHLDRPLVEGALRHQLPNLAAGMPLLLSDKTLLQKHGALLFFNSVAAAMEHCGIAASGLPKHDGWVFAATEEQAHRVRKVFQRTAEQTAGCSFPAKLEQISLQEPV